MKEFEYDRAAAVSYAHRWARSRNPAYYDYEKLGGDCTNFVSQCVYAGCGVMNYTRDLGWYYRNPNDKAPSWTGVDFLWRFLTGNSGGPGPFGSAADASSVLPGDIVQLSFDGAAFTHSLIVVAADGAQILVAAHSFDCDFRPLGTYMYESARFLHIAGAIAP